MSTRLLFICFSLVFGQLKSQTLSTVFIDTVKIVVDNKIIYESNTTRLKFSPNNEDCTLTLFNDTIYRFAIKFGHLTSKNLHYLSSAGEIFYINDSSCTSSSSYYTESEICSELDIYHISLKNWDHDNPHLPEKYKIRLCYRLCHFAPIDTTTYSYNYREGLWIGPDRGVEKVTVNYKNDKKQGLATAYYSDGVTFNVNYNNNVADNYGQGYWKNKKLKSIYRLPNIVIHSCDPIKLADSVHLIRTYNHPYFYFSQNKKLKEITSFNYLSIHSQNKGILHDSIEYNIKGELLNLSNDTITLKATDINIHDFYKKNTDPLHDHYKETENGFAKIPIKDISKIYLSRSRWNKLCTRTALLSALSAFVVSPLISIQKNGFNKERFRNVTLTSLGVMTLSISFGIGFSQKEYLLKSTKKSNKIWKIEYNAYE